MSDSRHNVSMLRRSLALLLPVLVAQWACGSVARRDAVDGGPGEDGDGADGADAGSDPLEPGTFRVTADGVAYPRVAGTFELWLGIDRGTDFAEDVRVEITGLPEGVDAEPVTIADGEDGTTILLEATDRAEPGARATARLVATTDGEPRHEGDLEVMVIGAAGSVDASFGDGGVATLPPTLGVLSPARCAVLTDGEIVIAGDRGDGTVLVTRLRPDGSVDDRFGELGAALLSPALLGEELGDAHVALQSDGHIVVTGAVNSDSSGNGADLYLARLTPSGRLDSGFAGGGAVIAPLGTPVAMPTGVAVDSDDRIVVLVDARTPTDDSDVMIARFTRDGEADTTFADGGSLRRHVDDSTYPSAIAPLDDGRLLVLATSHTFATTFIRPVALAFDDAGNPVAGFGEQGVLELPRAGQAAGLGGGIDVQAGDAVIVTGGIGPTTAANALTGAAWRIEGSGIDASWGVQGVAALPAVPGREGARLMAAAAIGEQRLLVAGDTVAATQTDAVIAELDDEGAVEASFGQSGFALVDQNAADQVTSLKATPDHRAVLLINWNGGQSLVRIWY
jgi:uncharacterized delta-60 repeat protein